MLRCLCEPACVYTRLQLLELALADQKAKWTTADNAKRRRHGVIGASGESQYLRLRTCMCDLTLLQGCQMHINRSRRWSFRHERAACRYSTSVLWHRARLPTCMQTQHVLPAATVAQQLLRSRQAVLQPDQQRAGRCNASWTRRSLVRRELGQDRCQSQTSQAPSIVFAPCQESIPVRLQRTHYCGLRLVRLCMSQATGDWYGLVSRACSLHSWFSRMYCLQGQRPVYGRLEDIRDHDFLLRVSQR